jgi:methyl-accepting chemotaxis protein
LETVLRDMSGKITSDQRSEIAVVAEFLKTDESRITGDAQTVLLNLKQDPALSSAVQSHINPAIKSYSDSNEKFVDLIEHVSHDDLSKVDAASVIAAANDASDSSAKLWTASVEQLDTMLDKRIDGLKSIRLNALLISSAVLLALAVGSLSISRSMVKMLRRTVESLSHGAQQVASASGQISASSQSLAKGASESAASLEETSSSLEEISSMTKKNADTAHQASVLSAEAKSIADKGNGAMTKMGAAIAEIEKSASQTAKIIKTIDEIAFQTNLLALNAAVEAARAGEAGKGFAVVAEEVRNLAMRSAEAAKNTAGLIEGSVQNAKNGVAIADQVAQVLSEITTASAKVNMLVAEIAAASAEQSQGVSQVNQAIQQMDKVTQSNAAAAEESAASAQELNSQSEQLHSVVGDLRHLVQGTNELAASPTPRQARGSRSVSKKTMKTVAGSRHEAAVALNSESKSSKESKDFIDFNVAA